MLEILEKLLVIQDRDRRIAQLKSEATRIPAEITAAEGRVKAEAARLENAKNELKHIEAERKKLEIDAESKRAQILKYRTQLNQIKSNTEYQALLKEIAKAEDDIRRIEDVELDLMERLEKLQPALKEEQTLLKELTAKGETEKADLQKRAKLIEQELAQLRDERGALVGAIDSDVLSRYERLLRSKGDLAIVPIKHGNCGGCHLNIPPQVVHDAKKGGELTSCSYCGRILYWEPE
jgi:predicted  nucleic acid-binding Zn-ribbon protein